MKPMLFCAVSAYFLALSFFNGAFTSGYAPGFPSQLTPLQHYFVSFGGIIGWVVTTIVVALLAGGAPYKPNQITDVRLNISKQIRIGWPRVDAIIQWVLSTFCGKPLPGQKPLFKKTWAFHLVTTLATLVLGVFLTVGGVAAFWYEPVISTLLLPWPASVIMFGWALTVGAVRKTHASLIHAIAHNQFSGSPLLDKRIAGFLGTLFFLIPLDMYIVLHIQTHHIVALLATQSDPDAKLMLDFGYYSTMSVDEARRHTRSLTFSRTWHFKFMAARLSVNLGQRASWSRRLGVLSLYVPQLLLVAWCCIQAQSSFPAVAFLLAWIIPLTVAVNISALLQFTSEHYWRFAIDKRDRVAGKEARAVITRLTPARFCADPTPPKNLRGIHKLHAWSWWCVRFFTVHLLVRLAVLPADVCCHNWHHLNPGDPRWVDAGFAYVQDIASGRWTEPRYEFWGIGAAMDAVFSSLNVLAEADIHTSQPSSDDLLTM